MSHGPCLGKGGPFARPTSCWAIPSTEGPRDCAPRRGDAGDGDLQPARAGRTRQGGWVRRRSLRCWQPWYDLCLVTGSVLCLLVVQVVREVVVAELACHHVIVLTPGRSTDPHFPPPHGVRWLQMACALVRVQESTLWHRTCIKHHVRRVVFILGTLRLPRGAAPPSTAARTEGAPIPSRSRAGASPPTTRR